MQEKYDLIIHNPSLELAIMFNITIFHQDVDIVEIINTFVINTDEADIGTQIFMALIFITIITINFPIIRQLKQSYIIYIVFLSIDNCKDINPASSSLVRVSFYLKSYYPRILYILG